jgi:hypothetical protein
MQGLDANVEFYSKTRIAGTKRAPWVLKQWFLPFNVIVFDIILTHKFSTQMIVSVILWHVSRVSLNNNGLLWYGVS